jgi:alkylhydroperoxidase/carboxymuconolactone decarboxylase family protein YurZ
MSVLEPPAEGARIYEAVPQLKRIRNEVLLGDVWKQPELSYRDRVLVTCSVLAATEESIRRAITRAAEAASFTRARRSHSCSHSCQRSTKLC